MRAAAWRVCAQRSPRRSRASTRRLPRAGAPQLRIALSEVRADDKHVRAVQFELTRGRYRRARHRERRGDVTLVGPFRAGKTEGPCQSPCLGPTPATSRAALANFLERFLEEATTP